MGLSSVTHAQIVLAKFADPSGLSTSDDGETLLMSATSGTDCGLVQLVRRARI